MIEPVTTLPLAHTHTGCTCGEAQARTHPCSTPGASRTPSVTPPSSGRWTPAQRRRPRPGRPARPAAPARPGPRPLPRGHRSGVPADRSRGLAHPAPARLTGHVLLLRLPGHHHDRLALTEHVEIINATGVLRRVALDGDGDATAPPSAELAPLLDPHTTAEEQGLFAELASTRIRRPRGRTVRRAPGDRRPPRPGRPGDHAEVEALENLLRRHIDKEENGIFPAAAVALDGAAWDRIQQRAP